MSYQLTNAYGSVEAVIDDNCGMKKFYSIAHTLSRELRVKFTAKQDHIDSTDWTFSYKGQLMNLHFNMYNGVSIVSSGKTANPIVTEIAALLEHRFF